MMPLGYIILLSLQKPMWIHHIHCSHLRWPVTSLEQGLDSQPQTGARSRVLEVTVCTSCDDNDHVMVSNETSSGLPRVKHSYYIFIPILYEPALPQSLLPFLFRPCLFLPSWFHSLKSLHCSRGQETRAVGALAEK